jgi:hypothetical protein
MKSLRSEALSAFHDRVSSVSRNFATLILFDLASYELGPVDTLRLETVVATAQDLKRALIVTAIDGKRPLVLNLESSSRATPPAIGCPVLPLVAGSLVDPLSNLRRNVTRLGFSI